MRQPPPPLPPFLPEELTVNILLRLPVRSLLRFMCVCKSWKTLISDPQFAKDHLRNSVSDSSMTHQQLVFFTNVEHDQMQTCSVQSLFENPSTPLETVPFKVEPHNQYIVGSCNGLLCLGDSDHCFRLLNPSTRLASKISPSADWNFPTHYGFGYDQVHDKYKVVCTQDFKTKVHSFGTNSWKRIKNFPCYLDRRDREGKFVSGTLNWLALKRDCSVKSVIASFDLEKETCGEVLLPPHMDGDYSHHVLNVLSNCLSLGYSNSMCCIVWLMKKYGIQESWTKLKFIFYGELGIPKHITNPSGLPLCISENGAVLVRGDLQLFMYDPNSRKIDYYSRINKRLMPDIHIYHESLVSPDVVFGESS